MGSMSYWHLVGLVFVLLYMIPIAMVVKKAGYSGWWCLLALVPFVNVIMLWVFAFASWPILRDRQA